MQTELTHIVLRTSRFWQSNAGPSISQENSGYIGHFCCLHPSWHGHKGSPQCSVITWTISDGIFIVASNFNQANMRGFSPTFSNMWILLRVVPIFWIMFIFYILFKAAFKTVCHPHLGSLDHISVMLIPAYTPDTSPPQTGWGSGHREPWQHCRATFTARTGIGMCSEKLPPRISAQTSRILLRLYWATSIKAWKMSVSPNKSQSGWMRNHGWPLRCNLDRLKEPIETKFRITFRSTETQGDSGRESNLSPITRLLLSPGFTALSSWTIETNNHNNFWLF